MRILAWLAVAIAFSATWAPLAHLLELPNKFRLEGALWLAIQQHLYNVWGPAIGAPTEIAGLVLSIVLAVKTRGTLTLCRNYLFAAVSYIGMILSFFLLNDPVNRALNGWTPATLPPDWTQYRVRWEMGYAFAALFSLCALVAVLLSLAKIEQRSTHE